MRSSDKIVDLGRLRRAVEQARAAGRTIALANGLFDILHVGHLRYLEAASQEADLLIVAVNSDASARRLKGPSRPVVPEQERAELLAGLGCVAYVTVFDALTVEELLRTLAPDVHCKGTDYTVESVPEARIAREMGIRVAICGDAKHHSTRDIIGRLRGPG
jgi:rfaE bifunctional protein nucleotidyltransferase chain/domain